MQYSHALNGFAVQMPAAAVNGLSHNPNVEFIEPDGEVTATGAPSVCPIDTRSGFPSQCVPPGAVRIGAEQSSARSGDGRGSVNVNVVGIVPGANLYSVRVLNKQLSATISRVICGVDWVTNTRTDSDPSNDIAVANMSLSGKGADDGNCGRPNKDALHLAICNSIAAGVTYITRRSRSASPTAHARASRQQR